MNYKLIKRLLLLSTLNICWQISPLAMEKEKDAMDVEDTQTGHKRSATHAGLYNDPIVYSLQDFPIELNKYLVTYFDLKSDQNTLFCLMESCAAFHYVIMDKYKEANKVEHHYPWQDSPSLYPSTVYILNSRMGTILGLYANIQFYRKMANNIDRLKFRSLCHQFLNKSLFSEASVPQMYVGLLQYDEMCSDLTPFQDPYRLSFMGSLETKKRTCIDKLSCMVATKNSELQNEHALYFHCYYFVSKLQLDVFVALKDTDPFRFLNGSLMKGMNTDLLTLKETPGLSDAGNFAETWKRIIELEPAVTIQQLEWAGNAYYYVGNGAGDAAAKAASCTKAAEYYEKRLKAILATGENPTKDDYQRIALAYFRVGEYAVDPATKAANYAKAAEYLEEKIRAIKATGETPPAILYDNIALAYFRVGEYAVDPATKAANYTKSTEYLEEQLKAIKATGETPPAILYEKVANAYFQVGVHAADPATKAANYTKSAAYYEETIEAIKATGETPPAILYENVAKAYFRVGKNALDSVAKAANYTKATEYYEEAIKTMKATGKNPLAVDYGNIANAYLQVGNYAADPATKAANYAKSAAYYEEQLKAIIATGKNPPGVVYNTAARAYFEVGQHAADPAIKSANYTKAAEYFNISLSKGLNDHLAEKTRNTLEKISAYLDNSNIEVYGLNAGAQGVKGVGG